MSEVWWDGFVLGMFVVLELALGLVTTSMVWDAAIVLWRGCQVDYGIIQSNCVLLWLVVGLVSWGLRREDFVSLN